MGPMLDQDSQHWQLLPPSVRCVQQHIEETQRRPQPQQAEL